MNKDIPRHLLPSQIEQGCIGTNQNSIKVTRNEVPRNPLQIDEHRLEPLANLFIPKQQKWISEFKFGIKREISQMYLPKREMLLLWLNLLLHHHGKSADRSHS